jgi:hypothetical protein
MPTSTNTTPKLTTQDQLETRGYAQPAGTDTPTPISLLYQLINCHDMTFAMLIEFIGRRLTKRTKQAYHTIHHLQIVGNSFHITTCAT